MHAPSLQTTIRLWQPLHLRVWRRVASAVQAAWQAVPRAPRERAQRVRCEREWRALTGLSAGTLKDIGAPDWAVLDAAERRDMTQRRLDDFGAWRGA